MRPCTHVAAFCVSVSQGLGAGAAEKAYPPMATPMRNTVAMDTTRQGRRNTARTHAMHTGRHRGAATGPSVSAHNRLDDKRVSNTPH